MLSRAAQLEIELEMVKKCSWVTRELQFQFPWSFEFSTLQNDCVVPTCYRGFYPNTDEMRLHSWYLLASGLRQGRVSYGNIFND